MTGQTIETHEYERIATAARKIARCYQAELGRCLTFSATIARSHQTVRLLQERLTEHGVSEVFHQRLARTLGHHACGGVWIIQNGFALEDLTMTRWLKTQLDLSYPDFRTIIILEGTPSEKLVRNLDLLGAIPVEAGETIG